VALGFPLFPLLRASVRQDLRTWGPYAFAATLAVLILGVPLFDLWEGGWGSTRSWVLGAGLLEGGLIVGMALYAPRPAVTALRTGTADGIRAGSAGWVGWSLADAIYSSIRGIAPILPGFVCMMVFYKYQADGGPTQLAPASLAAALSVEALHFGCLAVLARRVFPSVGASLCLLAAAVVARAAGVPAFRALVPLPLTLGGPGVAEIAASCLAAAGALGIAMALPPEGGRT